MIKYYCNQLTSVNQTTESKKTQKNHNFTAMTASVKLRYFLRRIHFSLKAMTFSEYLPIWLQLGRSSSFQWSETTQFTYFFKCSSVRVTQFLHKLVWICWVSILSLNQWNSAIPWIISFTEHECITWQLHYLVCWSAVIALLVDAGCTLPPLLNAARLWLIIFLVGISNSRTGGAFCHQAHHDNTTSTHSQSVLQTTIRRVVPDYSSSNSGVRPFFGNPVWPQQNFYRVKKIQNSLLFHKFH